MTAGGRVAWIEMLRFAQHDIWTAGAGVSVLEDFQYFFQLNNHLMNQLPGLGGVFFLVLTREPLAGTTNGKPLIIKERSDLADHQDVLALIVTAIAATLDGLQLGKFLFPVAQYMRFDRTEVADFTNSEISLTGDGWEFGVMIWVQHTPLLSL